MSTPLTSGRLCQDRRYAARFPGVAIGALQAAGRIGGRAYAALDQRSRMISGPAPAMMRGRCRSPQKSAIWSAGRIRRLRSFPGFLSADCSQGCRLQSNPFATSSRHAPLLVHGILGVRPAADLLAGGRIPRVAWTSKSRDRGGQRLRLGERDGLGSEGVLSPPRHAGTGASMRGRAIAATSPVGRCGDRAAALAAPTMHRRVMSVTVFGQRIKKSRLGGTCRCC
jgi:hypothetical protein